MAYIHLLNLYKRVDRSISEARALALEEETSDKVRFHEGRIALLSEFRQFLSDNMDHKLPKRIRKQLSNPVD